MSFIGTSGIRKTLPVEFPLYLAENSGNLIHGNAPARLFANTFHSLEPGWKVAFDEKRFRPFVDKHCSHIIITMANLFRVGDFSDKMKQRYTHFIRSIEGYSKPLVVFGMGAQANVAEAFDRSMLPEEGIAALESVGKNAKAISVRGEYTKSMLENVIGSTDDKVFVTGCPSYYTSPGAFKDIERLVESGRIGESPSINVTNLRREGDRHLLREAMREDAFYVEPSNASIHRFYLDSLRGFEAGVVPQELEFLLSRGFRGSKRSDLVSWLSRRYRLFRQIDPWLDFNRENVTVTIGTRFHVNMASVLSGVPAIWITHDARTKELVDALSLPSVDLDEAKNLSIPEIIQKADFNEFFSMVDDNFKRFQAFLTAAGLPEIERPRRD